ncbi:MAG: cystathionine gamma-synthase [Candidatus Zixiibacteriota bacterium]
MGAKSIDELHIATRAIHAGSEPDPQTGAVIVPIYQTSTYGQSSPGNCKGFEYSRTDNPTRSAYQTALASLEGGKFGLAFASGMAATDTIMKTLKPGDRVIAGDDLYGGTYRLFTTLYKPLGIEFEFVDTSGDFDIEPLITANTKYIWLESPTNPLLKISDIARIAKAAKAAGIPVIVDNTFMSPALQLPLELGADIVVHSTTKYIGGHSDTVGGAIITNNEELYKKFKTIQNSAGAVPGPFDCFIAHRGIKTLPLRMERHSANALKIAEWLESHKMVDRVIYPWLKSHPHFKIAKKQQSAGGGMISFEIKGKKEKALDIVSKTRIFTLAESLGGVESLIEHPGVMTHSSIPADIREAKGLSDRLIRLSVGIENVDDLLEDLDNALS